GGNKVGSVTAVKEEPTDIIGSLVNMKKEEQFSPNMSPVGFGSIALSGSNTMDQSDTTVKMELNAHNRDKQVSALGLRSDDIVACNPTLVNALDAERQSETTASHPNSSGAPGNGSGSGPVPLPPVPGQGVPSLTNFLANNNNVVSSNCLDYMQQQNHIFVFSTQLANKGAEAVLSGQYQTIIAYHCTQPATKTFLEDFFIKNPMKMNKMQRQNSLGGLGICNMPGAQNSWPQNSSSTAVNINSNANANVNLAKILQPPSQKLGGHKSLFNSPTDNANKGNNNFAADPTSADALVNESDLMCWETGNATGNRNNLDGSGQTSTESQSLKLIEGIDGVGTGGLGKSSNNELSLSADNNIISLQGVKVPDENLTPQQRQHREEQLAKIKKMNQFLFPENDKLQNESAMGNLMMNIPHSNTPQQMRQQMHQKSEHIQLGTEDVLMPMPLSADVIGDIGAVVACSQKNNLSCEGVASTTAGAAPGGAGGGTGSLANNVTQNANLLGTNSPEIMAAFGNSNCHNMMNVGGVGIGVSVGDKGDGLPSSQAGNQMTQMEWTKMQQHFFEERLKGGKASVTRSSGLGPVPGAGTIVQQPPSGGSTVSLGNTSNQAIRNNVAQGPPPPYHPTQRSASVPIATQSPNPSSPNNLSLPSPRTAGGALGLATNSPSMDMPTLNSSSTAAVSSTAGAVSKNCFQSDGGSPSSSRHRSAINHLNSNPTTPLSHISPKDLESFNPSTISVDSKNTRPSPQRTRSPGNVVTNLNSGVNHLAEQNNMDARFPSSSPGLNFNNQHGQHLQGSPSNVMNAFKGPNNPLEVNRQNCGPTVQQFARRADNMPLNPNSASNRSAPNAKMSQNFDPISSLAQMSQQLTSCVSGGVGGSPAGGMNMLGPPDVNMEHSSMMSAVALVDTTEMDHMNHNSNSNSCHSANAMLNPVMGQRMLNPKMCGFNTGAGPGPVPNSGGGSLAMAGSGFHGILPAGATRMMGRMPPVNFGPNFNANIQVKATTPNTIQYMPVRPHNNNNGNGNGNGNGSNVRMPPSLEFLQRYANPQMTGGPPIGHVIGNDVGAMIIGPGSGSMNVNSPNEQQQQQLQQQQQQHGNSKIINSPNNTNGIGMNFFQNCNQLPALDDEVGAAVVSGGQATMIRGMRPQGGMRQHGGMMARMQAPVNRQQVQFAGINADGLECNNDPAAVLFNNGPNAAAMFAASQHQQHQQQQQGQCKPPPSHQKPGMPPGMCGNVGMQGGPSPGQGLVQNHSHPVMGAPNSSNLMSTGGGNSVGSVNFVGPSSNDLKYAQQYHSFQQQLYATNTRSQQQIGGVGGGNMMTMPPNLSPNPAFFVSK
ncbi:hypothetical protein KR044_012142, partial [Drosophila immigrans]